MSTDIIRLFDGTVLRAADEWDESKHPRADDGKFTDGGSDEGPPAKPGRGASKAEKKAYDVAIDAYYKRKADEGRRSIDSGVAKIESRIAKGLKSTERSDVPGPHAQTIANDAHGQLPDVLYRGTKFGKFEDSPDATGGELGGGIYVTADKDLAANYANFDAENVVHTVEWNRKPTAKETGYVEAVGGDLNDQRLLDGNGHEIWRDRMTLEPGDAKEHRTALKEVAKKAGMKVLVGLSNSQGAQQISILDRSIVKSTRRESADGKRALMQWFR